MDYTLRIARRRPRGGMDTSLDRFDAPSVKAAVAHATELTARFLGGHPGVAVLTSAVRGIVWSSRHHLPAPPSGLERLR
ncbi:hypothetical protein Q8W71_13930 [Methylobacterium sp. NEAU 140]|uniref:hypothetical protein n=1 Tax=Methylobacterium sp. NEAU 140 TaxID=3064945 RepID=UPI002735CB67|nr:hypothetical protein [Methylobacterium sp. NEAU 140]MDP4023731.1 hypothetical protein [Methylobacterium sp. NEAU 140]